MKKTAGKRLAAAGLAAALVVSAMIVPGKAGAAKAVKKITVNKKKVTLYPGADAGYGSIQIKATVKPKGVKVKWKTNKKKVATVTAKGLIKAKKAGKATITAKAGKKTAKIKVTVKKIKKKVTKVSVANSSLTLNRNQSSAIKASVTPSKATLKTLTYKSSNAKVASVTAKGVVKGLQAGTATITVRAVDGSKKQAKVTVKVVDAAQPGTGNPTAVPGTPGSNPSAVPTQAPTNEPTQAPTDEPTQAPTDEPTQAPTEAPTQAPTEAPTQVPTDEPTQAPTDEPTQTPTTAPTEAPTTAPSVEPSAAPTETPLVTEDPEIPGNVKYTLDADTDYETTATVLGKEYSVTANDATAGLAVKSLAKAVNGLTAFYQDPDTYKAKAVGSQDAPVVYTAAEGVTISVYKNADDEACYVTVAGVGTDLDGTYQVYLQQWYAGEWNRTYYMQMKNYGQDGSVVNEVVMICNEMNSELSADGTKTTKYELQGLTVKLGDSSKVYADQNDDNDKIEVTTSYHETTKAGSVTIVKGNTTIRIACDGEGGYTISIPEVYQERYGIQITSK